MHADGVHVLHAAYGDGRADGVAHDLKLDFLPAEDVLLDQYLVYGRGLETCGCDALHLLLIVRHAAAGAAEREGRANDDRVAYRVRRRHGRRKGLGRARGDDGLADVGHGVLEQLPVLAFEDGLDVRAYEPDAVGLEEAGLVKLHGEIQAGLAAEAGEQTVGLFLFNNALDRAAVQRLDVDRVRHVGVGHDGRGVGVYEHGLYAFLHEGAAGLGARVVELRSLADHDGAGADDQNFFDPLILRHFSVPPSFQ